ncbi:MAG: BMP family ABC transporter substrate-binding protein [Anaerolineae bacterium]|nr:BMP family ABC transporter substrate-binding protein [Anaerolineae bacterium]
MLRKQTWTLVLLLVLLLTPLISACNTQGADDGEFVFGVVMVGPYNDHGWSEAHYEAGKYVEEKSSGARMIYLDKMNSADRPETTMEQVVDDMIQQGAKLIFTSSDDFQDDTDVVAQKYPDITFINISGDHAKIGTAPKNLGNYMTQMEYMKAVAGCNAALATETGQIGYLGPLINNETRRLVNAAYLGARHCYETYRGKNADDLKFTVTWIGFWFNIPGVTLDPTEVSNDLFNSGVDVLLSGIDTTEGIVVTKQRADQNEAVFSIPYDYRNACDQAPDVCLGVPYFNWGPGYLNIVKEVRQGKWKQHWTWDGPDWKGINNLDTTGTGYIYGPATTDEMKENLEEYIKFLGKEGWGGLFVGPLNWQDGSAWLADGAVASEDDIWKSPQLLEGIEGPSK